MHERHTRRHALRMLLALAASTAAAGARAQQIERWPAARRAPAFAAHDLDGRAWQLPLAGRAVALNFWASWCEPCRKEMPALQDLAEFYSDRLAVLAVNFKERAATATRFARQGGLKLPIVLDPEGALAKEWEVKVFPTTILIAGDGTPRWRVRGELDWTGAEAGRLVEGLWR